MIISVYAEKAFHVTSHELMTKCRNFIKRKSLLFANVRKFS